MKNAYFPPPQATPDEERLVALLEHLRPRPSSRFFRRMAAAPWSSETPSRRWYTGILAHPRLLVAGTLVLVFAILAFLTTPTLAVVARQLARFFAPNPNASMVIQVTIPSPGDPGVFGSQGYFALSLSEAEKLAGFNLKEIPLAEPDSPLAGLKFTGAHFDSDSRSVILRYSIGERSLFLSQRVSGTIQEFSSIGPNAPVEIVSVRGVEGEYVAGGWKAESSPGGAPAPGTQVSLDLTWDPSLSQHILRWQEEDVFYEILISAALGRNLNLGKDDLISIGAALK